MKICVVTWTCLRDLELALRHLDLVPPGWAVVWIVSGAEYPTIKKRVPARVELWQCDFNRGGSLRGLEAVTAMRASYKLLAAKGYDIVVKLDSDTAVWDWGAWIDPIRIGGADFAYIARDTDKFAGNGCVYAMGRRALDAIADDKKFYPAGVPEKYKGHEDYIFTKFFTAEPRVRLAMIARERIFMKINQLKPGIALASHYGYLRPEAKSLYRGEITARTPKDTGTTI